MAFTPLNALSAFVVVARRLSYASAAKDLGVSTSALSQSVRQLEKRVGTTLLTRTSRSVALTEAGQRLLERAGPAIDVALESLKIVKARRGELTGRLRLTVPGSAVPVLARLLPKFVELYPKVEVEVNVNDGFVDLVAHRYDAGIRLIESIARDMVHVRLTPPARLVVVGAPSYFERRGVPHKPADLLHHDCICLRFASSAEPWAWELERGKKTYRVPVRGPVITNSFVLMRCLAIAGIGLYYTLEPAIETDVARGDLRVVLEPYASRVPGSFLYYPGRAQESSTLKAFVDLAREMTRESKPALSTKIS